MAKGEHVTRAFLKAHPAEAANVLVRVSPEHCAALFNTLPARLSVPVFRHLLPAHAARCLEQLKPRLAAALLRTLSPQGGAAVLRHATASTRAQLLNLVPTGTALGLRMLLGYPGDVVGAWIDSRVPALPRNLTIRDALTRTRRATDEAGDYFYIVDTDQRLQGIVRLVHAIRANGRATLDTVMTRSVPTLPAGTSMSTAHTHAAWKDFHSLPVVDPSGRFLGALHHRVAIEAGRRRTSETVTDAVSETLVGAIEVYWVGVNALIRSLLTVAAGTGRRGRTSAAP